MDLKTNKAGRKLKTYNAGIETFIERLKKIRALNCSPSDVGINNEAVENFRFNRSNFYNRMF